MTSSGGSGDQHKKLLLIDDDDVDVRGFQRSLKRAGVDIPVRVAHNGEEGLDILRGENGQERLEPPFMIFLDLNMPRMNGFEFLDELRADPELRDTVVFVLTTSQAPGDLQRAYEHNVAGYLCKSMRSDMADEVVRLVERYMTIVQLPKAG